MTTQRFDFLLQSSQLLIIGLLQCLQLVSDLTASDVNLFEAIFIEQLIGAVAIEDGLEISNRVMICDAHQYLTKIIQMAQAACSLQGAYQQSLSWVILPRESLLALLDLSEWFSLLEDLLCYYSLTVDLVELI